MRCISWKMFEAGVANLIEEDSVGDVVLRHGDDE